MTSDSLSTFHRLTRLETDKKLSLLISTLPDHASLLKEAMEYALLVGGKRMRPLLVKLVGEALGVPDKDTDVIALAIECIHAYSLVHDDLPAMDDDDLRRGKPTCHIAFDEATAILAGDALQTLAFSHIADAPLSEFADGQRAKLISCLAKASGYNGMCGGQAIDLASTGSTVDIQTLRQLHNLKTGALLKACVDMVTIVSADVSSEQREHWQTFATAIGLAFQIQDDILDVTANTEQLGKPQGSDQALGKSTFPALLGMEGAKKELIQLHELSLQALHALPYNNDNLLAFCDLMVKRDH